MLLISENRVLQTSHLQPGPSRVFSAEVRLAFFPCPRTCCLSLIQQFQENDDILAWKLFPSLLFFFKFRRLDASGSHIKLEAETRHSKPNQHIGF
jgi:hypothetical protein